MGPSNEAVAFWGHLAVRPRLRRWQLVRLGNKSMPKQATYLMRIAPRLNLSDSFEEQNRISDCIKYWKIKGSFEGREKAFRQFNLNIRPFTIVIRLLTVKN